MILAMTLLQSLYGHCFPINNNTQTEDLTVCPEWRVQVETLDRLPSAPPAFFTEMSSAQTSNVLADTCKLLAIREVLLKSDPRECSLIQKVTSQVIGLCHYVS